MWARFTVLNETPIASATAGCVIPLSRSNTIWMRSRCAAGIFHRSAVFSSRICFLVHLTIRPPESDSQSQSYPAPSRDPKKRQKSLDSNSYGSGIRHAPTASPAGPAPITATSVCSTICEASAVTAPIQEASERPARIFARLHIAVSLDDMPSKRITPRANAGADDACQVRADERAPANHAGANACAVHSPTLPMRGHADDVHHECEDANDPLAHERDCDGGA